VQEQEQEKEQEVEEAAKKKYSRENESPAPWEWSKLAQPPDGKTIFQLASNFRIFRTPIQQTTPLAFPSYLWVSKNWFDDGWSLKFNRRIKNVICVMEWVPNFGALKDMLVSSGLTEQQSTQLKMTFDLFDVDNSKTLSLPELKEVLKARAATSVLAIRISVSGDIAPR
jgi:hypothetical protein